MNSKLFFSVLCLTVLLLALHTVPVLAAQREAVVEIHHGRDASFLRYDTGNGPTQTALTNQTLVLPPGTKVRVVIVDANTYYYNYSLDKSLEQPRYTTPDLSTIVAAINRVLPVVATAIEEQSLADDTESTTAITAEMSALGEYVQQLETVRTDIEDILQTIAESDNPSSPADIARGEQSQLLKQQKEVLKNSTFSNARLKDELQAGYSAAHIATNKNTTLSTVVQMLREYGEQLLATRDKLKRDFLAARDRVEFSVVVPHDSTLVLRFGTKPRDPDHTARATGDTLLAITLDPLYQRPSFELFPLAFGIIPLKGVPEYSIVDSVIAEHAGSGLRFRAGTMMMINFASMFDNTVGIGAGVGIGLSTDAAPLIVDYLFGITLSYLETIRLGLGAGVSHLPDHLKAPAAVGKPLPPDAGSIDDLVENTYKPSFFITISLPGLNIFDSN